MAEIPLSPVPGFCAVFLRNPRGFGAFGEFIFHVRRLEEHKGKYLPLEKIQ